MSSETRRAVIAIPIVLLIGTGLALAGSYNGARFSGIPIFAISIMLAFLIQWVVFIPAFLKKTEMFFDLTGSLTYLSVTIVAVLLSPKTDLRTYLLLAMISIWALRLGSFLFSRILKAGEDRRFREIKTSFPRFLLTWTLQGLWVSFSTAAALAAITSTNRPPIGVFAIVGFVVWLVGFTFEAVADQQKRVFRAKPENKDAFINTGLWAWSRHPNYFGEILLWIGITIVAIPALQGWQWITLISPIFVTLLLTRISGVPMLESRADEKWGGQANYEAYKANTPVLIPRPPKSS